MRLKIAKLFQKQDLKKGIALVLCAWLCASTLYMLSKLIKDQTTVSTMVFFRSIVGVLIVLPWTIKNWPKSIELYNFKVVAVRSLVGLFSLLFVFLAVGKISLINATLLNNSAPFFVPLILWLWLRKPIDHKLWPAIILGFIGVALILEPDHRLFNVGAAYGILSGICLALSLITMRMASKNESLYSFAFYFFAIGTIVSLPFALANWQINGWLTLIALVAMGVLSFAAQIFLFHGLKHGKTHQLAPFSYSVVVFSGIYELLIWGKIPKPLAYVGIILIVAAGIWIAYLSRVPKNLSE